MIMRRFPLSLLFLTFLFGNASAKPIRVLFLGHESKHHNSNEYFPILSKALGRDAIYFDYVTSVGQALDDAKCLDKFDASPMPPIDILLDRQEIADVMSYLLTLK